MAVPQVSLKLRVYRQCRLWHGYLSAFAFLILLFFAITGILLNHPGWFSAEQPRSPPVALTLTPPQLQALRSAKAPAQALTAIVAKQTPLYGEYEDGDAGGDQISVRLRGTRGTSNILANTQDGSVMVISVKATTAGLFNALHRGEHAGTAWRAFIDAAAAVLIVLSLVGYAIFFSMINKRLRLALVITSVSVIALVTFFFSMVS